MGIFIFLPKQKGQGRRRAGGCPMCLFSCSTVLCAGLFVCVSVQACECNCCLLSLSKLERSEDAQQPMKGTPGDIVRDIGRLWVSNDQSNVWQPSLSGDNGTLFAALRRPRPTPTHLFSSMKPSYSPMQSYSRMNATSAASSVLTEPLYLTVIYKIPAWVFFTLPEIVPTEGFFLLFSLWGHSLILWQASRFKPGPQHLQ